MHLLRSPLAVFTASVVISCAFVVVTSQAFAQPIMVQNAPDNSNQNTGQAGTADTQSNASADRHTTANIRRAIVHDKNLSTYAHNVKILTANGAVTLKGPVKSDDEKQQVAADAATVVSADKITNELTVKQ